MFDYHYIRKDEIIYANRIVIGKDISYKLLSLITSDKFYDVRTNKVSYYEDVVVTLDGDYFYFTWKKINHYIFREYRLRLV